MRLMLERNRFELHLGIVNQKDIDMWESAYCFMDDYEQNITSVLKMARITAPYTL